MSLLGALAKGFGAGVLQNAQQGFDKIKRDEEAAQRNAEQKTEWENRNAQLHEQIQANKEDTDRRLSAQATENDKQRQHDWDMFERKLAEATTAANRSNSVASRANAAKNIMGRFDSLSKIKSEIASTPEDKMTQAQRDQAIANIDMQGYLIASDPNAQQLVSEFGGAGQLQYWLSLAPTAPKQDAPPQQPTAAQQPEPVAPPKPTGPIQNLQQGSRETEQRLYQAGKDALTANPNPSATAAEAYRAMYRR